MELEGYPRTVTLKNGASVLVRPIASEDGPALAAFFRDLPEEDRLFLRDDVTRPDFVEQFLRTFAHERVLTLVAEQGGRVVGDATLYRNHHAWTSHVAQLRVAVSRELQRQGLGTQLIRGLVKLAASIGLDKLVAEVADNQVAVKRAFERLGFHQEALLKGHIKDLHGIRRDLAIMSNDVSHIWERMEAMVADYSPTLGG